MARTKRRNRAPQQQPTWRQCHRCGKFVTMKDLLPAHILRRQHRCVECGERHATLPLSGVVLPPIGRPWRKAA